MQEEEKIKIIRESYIFISAVKKPNKQKESSKEHLLVQAYTIEILVEQVILSTLIQPHSESAISPMFQHYEELTLTRNKD